MAFLIIVLTLTALVAAMLYKKYGRQIKLAEKLPGPRAWPVLGNGLILLNKTPPEFVILIGELFDKFGKSFRLWLGPQLLYISKDPKEIEVILSSPKYIEKSDEYSFMWAWLGDGLLVSNGKKWHQRRKVITPAFHFKILEDFVEIFDKQGDLFVEKMAKKKSRTPLDIFPDVTLCALDTICESAMGTSINAQVNSDSPYVEAVKEITNVIHLRTFDFLLRLDGLFRISSLARRQKRALKVLHNFTDNVILARRNELVNSIEEQRVDKNDNDLGIKKKSAFLDILLQSTIEGKPLTNLEIREEVDTFMFEGHDTTSSGICFVLYNLAKYPEIQEKVWDEIQTVIGTDVNVPVIMQQLNDMHYLELVVKETLRLYPSVPLFGRKIREDIEINGKTIPENANFLVGTYFMGRDADLFPNPEEFIPERYNGTTSAEKQNPYAYIPFSAGPRNCIGQKFAMLELKSMVSKVIRHFKLSLPRDKVRDPVLVAELILRPDNGIWLEIEPRA